MPLPKEVKSEIGSFNLACDEFMSSKLILIEKSISNILKSIVKGGAIYNTIAEELVGYNFNVDYENVLSTGSFDLLQSDKNLVPFVFHLLNDMDNGNIDIFNFVKKVFGENSQDAYHRFCDVLIVNFKIGVQRLLEEKFKQVEVEEEPQSVEDDLPVLDDAFVERIKFVVENIMTGLTNKKVLKLKTRNDINTVCVSIIVCLNNGEHIGVLGLLLGLRGLLTKVKFFKNDVTEISALIETFNEI